jgi:hypothetical protein
MEIVVFAEQFRDGHWDVWEYECNPTEANAIVDSALSRAKGRAVGAKPIHDDFLASARRQFDVAQGTQTNPRNGDLRVYCVCVDKLVIGVYEKIRQYSHRLTETHQFVEAGLQMSA